MIRMRISAVVLLVACSALPAAAQQDVSKIPTITLSGEGSVSAPPDHVILRAGVTTQGKTLREAGEANAKAMQAVVQALSSVPSRDIQTTRLAVQPIYEQPSPPRTTRSRITGFQMTNQVVVKVSDQPRAGDLLDALMAAGANEIGGIEFGVSEVSKKLDEARVAAVADARRKAEIYAKAAGVGLGRVVGLSEQGSGGPPMYRMERMAAAPSVDTPIMQGEQTLRVNVSVMFQIIP